MAIPRLESWELLPDGRYKGCVHGRRGFEDGTPITTGAVTKRVALRDGWGAAKAQLCADHGFAPDRVEKLEVSPFFAGTPRRPHVHRVR